MGHFRADASLCADPEMIDHAVACSKVLNLYGCRKGIRIHISLVDVNPAVAGHHVSCAVHIVTEHGFDLIYNPSLKLAMDIAKVFGKTVEEVFEFQDEE